jgi:RNA polymerase sigma-70 factor, ECF subfamily
MASQRSSLSGFARVGRLLGSANDATRSSGAAVVPSREALLQACASGDRAALRSLYQLTAPQLFGLANSIVRSRELAEDAVQDSFVQVWRHAHRFDPARGAAMAWLASIVRNRCFDLLRRHQREAPFDDAIVEAWESRTADSTDGIALSREAQRLRDCINELDENPRKSVLLAYYGGLTAGEVAARLGAPLGTVKSWIRRSLIQLKRCVEDEPR